MKYSYFTIEGEYISEATEAEGEQIVINRSFDKDKYPMGASATCII